MSFEEAIHLVSGADTQQPPRLRYGEFPGADAFQGNRFQRSDRHTTRIGGELTGKILGDFQLSR